ncbi:membrane protein [Kwoniella mangroviensis CBS 10435]|uniref:Membrane protein n=1 Tax=Kwoniella mangroviensis CBS 10435 TaxID=1331196 RepID=A0A1B9IZ04_9TREE|nr:uncharacterized protein I203_06400 [Kwoniella mangroviensis CBS 8507]OCF60644.1 membrane protein [Kwoniella mangroviensis CBS 10435]OCF64665.1 membrane protein [Kwoniella mangroviensis CBS 8507]
MKLNEKDAVQLGLDPQLPRPTTSTVAKQWSRRKTTQVIRLSALLGIIFYLSIYNSNLFGAHHGQNDAFVTLDDSKLNSYWHSIATKGMKFSLPRPEKHPDHDDHHHKHPHQPHGHLSPREAEKIFLSVPSNDSAAAASERYTSYAHPAGSGYDLYSALALKNEWEKELGLRVSGANEFVYEAGSAESQSRIRNGADQLGVWVDTYYPVLNTPVHASVTLLTDTPFKAKLREDIVDGDPDSQLRDEVPVFHGLSASGDVKAKYVYAGYGRKKDFDLLQEKGVDFNGKIVLTKYGGSFRGLKVKAAQEAGAAGVIVFTDPGDDGEITEANGYEAYPEGPARQPSSVQRGSVQFLSKYPGDPSTPGEPAYKNATRVESGSQPSIPSLPLSYEDVIPLLKALEGKGIHASELGSDFTGGLEYHGVDYYIGPSDVDLHLVNEMNDRVLPIWNTMAVIPGHITDEVIILGNHRDAWVLGASDPNSGTASQYEVVRGLGALLKRGWKPLRTIILTSWDAEEYGLVGSVEWAEDFGDWLVDNAVAYLNIDGSASGTNFHASASPSIALALKAAAEEINSSSDPERAVYDTRYDGGNWEEISAVNSGEGQFETLTVAGGSGIGALGSGSDYTPFLQRYGIASSDLGYKGGPRDPVYHYHSIYDSHTWQAKYGDVGFHRHTDAAKVIGLLTLRLADTLILPLNTTQYARDLQYYLEKVQDIANSSSLLLDGSINFDALELSIESVGKASTKLDKEKKELVEKLRKLLPKPKFELNGPSFVSRIFGKGCNHHQDVDAEDIKLPIPHLPIPKIPSPHKLKEIKEVLKEIRVVNKKLQHFEYGFISEKGLKDREWYKHKITAPGLWLGYGATTFPSITEAITIDHSSSLAQKEVDDVAQLLNSVAQKLNA